DGIVGTADDGFAESVEGCIDEDRNARSFAKAAQQRLKTPRCIGSDRLNSHRRLLSGKDMAEARGIFRYVVAFHERGARGSFEVLVNRRSETTERVSPPHVAPLQEPIEILQHVRSKRVR